MDETLYRHIVADNISKRYLSQKLKGLIESDKGALSLKSQASEALTQGKNLLIIGKTGMGKSYLAFELAFDLKMRTKGDGRFYYNRAIIIHSDYKANYNNISKTLDGILAKPSFYYEEPNVPVELIIIDEIDDLQDFTIINEIIISAYDSAIPVILIGNIDHKELLDKISIKALSRLQENIKVFALNGQDLRTKNV